MTSQIIVNLNILSDNILEEVSPPRYDIPYAKKEILLLEEGHIIYQWYSTFLFFTELVELRLDKPLIFPYSVIDNALFVNFILQGDAVFTTARGDIFTEAQAGKCYASINKKDDYIAHFEATTHILACITPRMEWVARRKEQNPLLHGFVGQFTHRDYSICTMEKSLIDKNIGRYLLDMWQLVPGQYDDFEQEMDGHVKRLFKAYEKTLNSKYYLTDLSSAEKIRLVGDYLKTNFTQADITNCKQLCKRFFLVERTMRRIFKKEYNCTINTYVENLRLKCAVTLLLETLYTVENISRQSGFKNSNYFCRVFRKKYSCSPVEYRKAHACTS